MTTDSDEPGIYFAPRAQKALLALPLADRRLLADFLNAQLAELNLKGGGAKEGCVGIWKTDWVVSWDVELKPTPPRNRPERLGGYYRIVVHVIKRLSRFRVSIPP